MKAFRQMSRRVSLSLSQFKPLFIRAFSLNALHTHTHIHAHTGTQARIYTLIHTLHLPLVAGLSECFLCVFNYAPSDRPLLRICRCLSVCSLANGYAAIL